MTTTLKGGVADEHKDQLQINNDLALLSENQGPLLFMPELLTILTDGLLPGLLLGLAAGWTPGPLSVLVIDSATRRGLSAGISVAMVPLVTDTIVVPLALLGAAQLKGGPWLGLLGLAGGGYLMYLAASTWRATNRDPANDVPLVSDSGRDTTSSPVPHTLWWRAVRINLLSPHPWLFWGTIGATRCLNLWHQSPAAAWLFVPSFYIGLVGSKVFLAFLAERVSRFWNSSENVILRRILAALLALFGFQTLYLAVQLWKE